RGHLLGVQIHADHVVAGVREARARNQTDVPCPNHRDTHPLLLTSAEIRPQGGGGETWSLGGRPTGVVRGASGPHFPARLRPKLTSQEPPCASATSRVSHPAPMGWGTAQRPVCSRRSWRRVMRSTCFEAPLRLRTPLNPTPPVASSRMCWTPPKASRAYPGSAP